MAFINTYYEGFTVITTTFEEIELVLTEDEATFYMYASGEVDWEIYPAEENIPRHANMADLRIYDLVVFDEDNNKIVDYNYADEIPIDHGFVNSALSMLSDNIPVDWDQIDAYIQELKADADMENKRYRSGYYELGDPDE